MKLSKTINLLLFFILFSVLTTFTNTQSAEAAILCLGADGETVTSVKREKRCNRKGGTRLTYTALKGNQGEPGPAGEDGSSTILCFAKVQADGTVVSFGGNGTTSVTAAPGLDGVYVVTCAGKYPGITSADDIHGFATSQSSLRNAAETHAGPAGEEEIRMTVLLRNLNSFNLEDGDFVIMAVAETS